MKWRGSVKVASLLAIVGFFLFEFLLHWQSDVFREFEIVLLSVQWMLLACIAVWCGTFIFLTFSLKDLPLIGLLIIATTAYFINYAVGLWLTDAVILLAGVTLGKETRFFLKSGKRKAESGNVSELRTPNSELRIFLAGLVVLLAFSSWWHLDMSANYYHGPRWMGLWNNPNIYGMLMGAGLTLAIGLLAGMKKEELRRKKLLMVLLLVSSGMIGVGLVFSYSRGAWFGTAVGLLYLAKIYGKLKWQLVLPGILVVAVVVSFFWHSTADTDPWYLKRLDLSRPSAQHRVSAWRGALQMMRDHPFGVGWNKAIETYDKNYSPPEGGAAAITMNSYLMLGTELGLPGLLCFVTYVWLCFRNGRARHSVRAAIDVHGGQETARPTLQTTCRAGALVLLVAFWFDGGLFDLPAASVFWILLELGAVTRPKEVKQSTESNSPSIISA
jgi:hypothetical protein